MATTRGTDDEEEAEVSSEYVISPESLRDGEFRTLDDVEEEIED